MVRGHVCIMRKMSSALQDGMHVINVGCVIHSLFICRQQVVVFENLHGKHAGICTMFRLIAVGI